MKKIALMLALVLVLMPVLTVEASAADYSKMDAVSEAVSDKVVVNGVEYTFYKEGLQYKVRDQYGNIKVWAYDELISSKRENVASPFGVTPDWVYIQTDRYATHINYEVLLPMLEQADAWATLSAQLGVTIAVLSYIFSYSPEFYYREDISYYHVTDPLYFMMISNFYSDNTYRTKIDSVTKYWHA